MGIQGGCRQVPQSGRLVVGHFQEIEKIYSEISLKPAPQRVLSTPKEAADLLLNIVLVIVGLSRNSIKYVGKFRRHLHLEAVECA